MDKIFRTIFFRALPLTACFSTLLQWAKELRTDSDSIFFVSYVVPHENFTSKTNATWVMKILNKPGTNRTTLKAHSVRKAGSSKPHLEDCHCQWFQIKLSNWNLIGIFIYILAGFPSLNKYSCAHLAHSNCDLRWPISHEYLLRLGNLLG